MALIIIKVEANKNNIFWHVWLGTHGHFFYFS